MGNDFSGIDVSNAPATTIGGTAAGAGNIISAMATAASMAEGNRAILYGTSPTAQIRAENIREIGAGGIQFTVLANSQQAPVTLHLLGRHNVLNALAAIAAGVASGIPLAECAQAIATMRAPDKRGQILHWRGATLINDCYNSNPAALNAMVDALLAIPAQRHIVVAGEMLELGVQAAELHRASGAKMQAADLIIGVRGHARDFGGLFFETPAEAGEWLLENLREGDAVLLKGSRGVRLEGALSVLGLA